MRNIDEIVINKIAVSILDKDNNTVVLPDYEMELTEETYEYFEKHLLKGLHDDEARTVQFDGDNNILKSLCKEIFEDEESFLINSRKIFQYLFKCVANEEEELSGDAAVCLFECQQGKLLSVMKLNFTNSYNHYIKQTEDKVNINIGVSKTGLPGINQKPSKIVFIMNIKEDSDYRVMTLDRQREGYFANSFIKCTAIRDRRENTRIFHRVSENFARKAFKDNAQEAEEFRSRLTEKLRSENTINVEGIAENNFQDEALKNEYKAVLISEGLNEKEVEVDREWVEKKLKRKRLKVDKSIELYIDTDVYNDKDKFQVKRNGDGTIDIILKNIKNYIER